MNFTHKIILSLPDRIDLCIVNGAGKNSEETMTFEDVPEGTKVTYKSDFKLDGMFGKILDRLAD